MIIEIPNENSIIKWKNNTYDEWKVAEISDLIKAYEMPKVTVFAENASKEEIVDFKQELEKVLERPQGYITEEDIQNAIRAGYENGYSMAQAKYQRSQGEWIKEDDEHLKGWYRCSECGRRVEDLTDDVVIHAGCEDYTIADIYPYCHCGAKMKGGEEE